MYKHTYACVCAISFLIFQPSIHVRMELNLLQNVSNLPIPLSQEPWLCSHTKQPCSGKVHWIIWKSKRKIEKGKYKITESSYEFVYYFSYPMVRFPHCRLPLLRGASCISFHLFTIYVYVCVCVCVYELRYPAKLMSQQGWQDLW